MPTENAEKEEESEEQYGLPDQMQKAKSLLPEDNKEGATTNIQSQILSTLNEQEKKMIQVAKPPDLPMQNQPDNQLQNFQVMPHHSI